MSETTQPKTPAVALEEFCTTFAEPTRWNIIRELTKGQALPVMELARRVGRTPAMTSKHLAWLRTRGVVVVLRPAVSDGAGVSAQARRARAGPRPLHHEAGCAALIRSRDQPYKTKCARSGIGPTVSSARRRGKDQMNELRNALRR